MYKTPDVYIAPHAQCDNLFKQAVEIYLCRVRPLDNDTSWTGRSTAFMSNLIFNKTLDGVILLTMGNTLWVDTLVEKVKLKEVNVVNTLYNVKSQLIQNHYGEENNQVCVCMDIFA